MTQPRLFGEPDPFDTEAWFGCSCKVVWLAIVAWGIRDYIRQRGWCA